MAARRRNPGSDSQLDLFSYQRPTDDTTDSIRTDGRETLARTPAQDGAGTRSQGLLHQMLLEAEEKTKDEMIALLAELRKQGLTPQQAHDRAWEMVGSGTSCFRRRARTRPRDYWPSTA